MGVCIYKIFCIVIKVSIIFTSYTNAVDTYVAEGSFCNVTFRVKSRYKGLKKISIRNILKKSHIKVKSFKYEFSP